MDKYKKKISIKEAIKMLDASAFSIYENVYKKILGDRFIPMKKVIQDLEKNARDNKNKSSLLVGEVQSGKTSAFLGVMAQFFDNGSNLSLIFPATDNVLLHQSTKRIHQVFGKHYSVFSLGDFETKEDQKISSASIKKLVESMSEVLSSENGKVILIGLKNPVRIKQAISALEKTSHIERMVVIDDEGDQASFDNIKEEEATSTYKQLSDLRNKFKPDYITVTATPYAHIFVDSDSLSKPDFAFAIPGSKDYTGLNHYHNDNFNAGVLEEITPHDKDMLVKMVGKPKSLVNALTDYFIACALFQLLTGKLNQTSFLLHTHRENIDHNNMKKMVKGIITRFHKGLENGTDRHITLLRERIKTFKYFELTDKEIEDIIRLVQLHAIKSNIEIGNQTNKNFKSTLFGDSNMLNTIFIGSQMLQRGVTLPNLLVTYFMNRADGTANADTVLQRARWFGYRKDYFYITKLYLDNVSKDDFSSLLIGNQDLFDRLNELPKHGFKFAPEFFEERLFVGKADLRGTSTTKANNSKIKIKRSFVSNSTLSNHGAENLWNHIDQNGKIDHELKYKYIEFPNLNLLKDVFSHDVEAIFGDAFLKNPELRRHFEEFALNSNMKIIIVNMGIPFKGYDAIRERTLIQEGKKYVFNNNFLAGRSTEGSKPFYFGDLNISKHDGFKGAITIQINKFKTNLEVNDGIIYKGSIHLPIEKVTDNVFKK